MIHSSGITDFSSAIRLFGEILDAGGTGLIVQSAAANLTANATALRLLGTDEAALREMPPGVFGWRALHADGRSLAHEELPHVQALRSRCPVTDRVFRLADQAGGQQRRISMSAVPMPAGPAGEDLLYCFIKDVSAAAPREEIAHSDRETARTAGYLGDDVLAMLSHELRTPLNGIMGMLQLALHSRSRDSIQEYLTVALESSKHMILLLSDISELASGDTASPQIRQEAFDLESVIAPTIASFTTSTASKGLNIVCRIDPALPKRLLGDPGRIRQITFNLLANAVKQTDRGSIVLQVSPLPEDDPLNRRGLHIIVRTADAGKTEGPPSGQAADGSARDGAGMGLGLSIVKHLVKILDGEISVSSRQDEVQVLLPLHARQEAKPAAPAKEIEKETVRQSEAPKILVVEDEPINLKTMLLSLQLLGCKAVGADSAYKGLALLRKEKFDAVLMDIQMPGLDGLEATRLIRGDTSGALDSGIPIVAITAHAMQGDRERILKAGVDEYLAKPVYLEQLQSVLSAILKRPLELKTG
ncbi:MAG: response regulator [Deltaproteobacteria bacterium]|jgi:signal transduction histidine kinase/ActR/RegA family two-component response regulator|nr:response regulator [Deltaproteobacteria bacterium]